VGITGEKVYIEDKFVSLVIKAESRGSRQMCRVDKFGFPRTSAKLQKRVHHFQTGDLVKANVTSGQKLGSYTGRVAIRTSGFFNIKTQKNTIQGIHHRFCHSYKFGDAFSVIPMLSHRSLPEGISIPIRPEGRSLLEI
jgi:hypothetical protein